MYFFSCAIMRKDRHCSTVDPFNFCVICSVNLTSLIFYITNRLFLISRHMDGDPPLVSMLKRRVGVRNPQTPPAPSILTQASCFQHCAINRLSTKRYGIKTTDLCQCRKRTSQVSLHSCRYLHRSSNPKEPFSSFSFCFIRSWNPSLESFETGCWYFIIKRSTRGSEFGSRYSIDDNTINI